MKEKVLIFIIGLLIGAIIATAGFIIYQRTNQNNNSRPQMQGFPEGGPMMDRNNMQEPPNMNGNNMEKPPEKPSGDNGQAPPNMSNPPDIPLENGQIQNITQENNI